MAFANPFALSLRQAHLQRTGFKKAEQADHGEHYSGWQPKIPRINHLDPMERVAHISNVESRRRRQQLMGHVNQLKADMRGDNEKQRGPGVPADALDRWSRTRNLDHPKVELTKKDMIRKDLEFIQRSKDQMTKMKREKRLPLPHVASRNPTWKQMHLETMQRSFSALGPLELTGEVRVDGGSGELDSTAAGGAGAADDGREDAPPRAASTINAGDSTEFAGVAGTTAESAFRRSVTFAATTDSIDNFWEQREADLFN